MADLLWQKPGVAVDAQIQTFLAGDDVILDREFFLHDIAASKAHAQGLRRIGMLSEVELAGLERELDALAGDFHSGAFELDARYEDGHSAIEARLAERLGETGKKIHAGRSRNDQVLVATRLWLKAKLAALQGLCIDIARIALDRAQAEADVPLPGYTHLQRAVVSSLGMWWTGWAEAFIDDAQRARDTAALVDANPLGTAAGYGVNLPLDRDGTTQALGFARLQVSPTYAQLSRGKYELAALEALGGAMLDLGIYPLSFASLVLGGISSAAGLGSLTDRGVDRRVAFVVQGPSGAVASCATDMSVSSPTTASVNGTWARLELETQFYTPTTMRLVGAKPRPSRAASRAAVSSRM